MEVDSSLRNVVINTNRTMNNAKKVDNYIHKSPSRTFRYRLLAKQLVVTENVEKISLF
jgi:hypothetical protein